MSAIPTREYRAIAAAIIIAGVLISASLLVAIGEAPKGTITATSVSTTITTSTATIVSSLLTTSEAMSSTISSATSQGSEIDSPGDLQLELFIGQPVLVGQSNTVQINLTEYNTAKDYNNVSIANDWPESYLSAGGLCGQGRFPFGIAVYQGNYTVENIASATPLVIFATNGNINSSSDGPSAACPAIPQFSYYDFSPSSDSANATVVCGPECTHPVSYSPEALSLSFSIAGYWNNSSSFVGFGKGTYTILAGDEWGHTSIQYFMLPVESF